MQQVKSTNGSRYKEQGHFSSRGFGQNLIDDKKDIISHHFVHKTLVK